MIPMTIQLDRHHSTQKRVANHATEEEFLGTVSPSVRVESTDVCSTPYPALTES